jgi:excisionase family DNA binding protein
MARRLYSVPVVQESSRREPVTNPALLSVEEAARQLGVGIRTARAWVADGTLYSTVVGVSGRVRRVPAGEVERIRCRHGNDEHPRGAE